MPRLHLKPEIEALSRLFDFCDEQGVDARMRLALEEAFANVVAYSGASRLDLALSRSENEWKFVLEDDGVAFDPTGYVDEPPSGSHDDLKIGGKGILIMHNMADSICYQRKNNKNILTLVKSYNTKD